MNGQEIQEWHDWALFPYFLDFWFWNFFLFVLFLIWRFLPIIAVFCLLLQLFPFLRVLNISSIFFTLLRLKEVGLGIIGRNDHKTDGTDVNQYALLFFTTLCNYNALQVRLNASIVVSRLYFLNIAGRQRNDRPTNILIFEGASSVDTPTSCRRNNIFLFIIL